MPQPTKIADCMRRRPLTINRDANLVQAIETLVEYKPTGVTVVDDKGRPVGVLSELDCIEAVLAAIYNDGDPELAFVHEAMTADINSCRPGDNIVEVAQDMLRTRQRRRPVIDTMPLFHFSILYIGLLFTGVILDALLTEAV